MTYVYGALVSPKVGISLSDEHDDIDGFIAADVFTNMSSIQSLVANGSQVPVIDALELAILSFIESFRKSYLCENAQRASRLFGHLSERFGLSDVSAVLEAILQSLVFNFKYRQSQEKVIRMTLTIFDGLCSGYTSIRRMRKLQLMTDILQNHTTFGFLGEEYALKLRCGFYSTLTRILFSEESSSIETELSDFLAPFTDISRQMRAMLARGQFDLQTIQVCNSLYNMTAPVYHS